MPTDDEVLARVRPSRPLSILCVCTGNVCRSPAAERLLQQALGSAVEVRSAGTYALVSEPVDPAVADLLTGAGADPANFASRELNAADLLAADLVLALAREHRTAVVELAPSCVRRSFTLRELARILGSLDPAELPGKSGPDRMRAIVRLAAARRRRSTPAEDDVPDSYRGSPEQHLLTFTMISDAVDQIADVLVDASAPAQPLG